VAAQRYPERPLRFLIPFTPGGGADNLARIVSVPAAETLGQPIVIDNRAGAGGNIAAELAAKANADGYTLLQGNISHTIAPSLYRNLNYSIVNDFTAVTQLASIPFLLAVNPAFNANSVKDIIALAQAKPGQINCASSGASSPSHLAMEKFKAMANVNLRHIPYKGAIPATTDLIAGQVQMMFITVSAALPLARSGRLKAIAMGSTKRSPLAPDIPTLAESGVACYEATTWFGVNAPKGVTEVVVRTLHRAFTGALKRSEVQERLANQGFDIIGNTPEVYAEYIKSEIPKWAKVIKAANITAD
jgi:tripartite-type tricarboxylate transporter receptor subunit TctC